MPILFILLVICAMVAIVVVQAHLARKRREAMAGLAARLGLRYSAGKDHELARQYRFLDRLARGSSRYAFNVLFGDFRGHRVLAFDYHYATHSTDSKGRRRTHHHYLSFFILTLPRAFKEVTVAREGVLSKLAQAIGFDDIDFESHEFSRRYCVRSSDKRLAYDVCNGQMIEYLLANPDLTLEIEGNALAIGFDARLAVEQVEHNLNRLVDIREKLPDYLFDRP